MEDEAMKYLGEARMVFLKMSAAAKSKKEIEEAERIKIILDKLEALIKDARANGF